MIENPIIKGFNPDPCICKKEDDYYIATSTFEWFPGVQIFHSKDLKNWRLVCRPLNRVNQLDMLGIPDSGGVWAPCLTYSDNKFWLVYSIMREHRAFKDVLNFVVTAESIDGEWSDPVFLNSSGFDPSLFHDSDGKKYLLNMVYDYRNNNPWNYGIVMQEYDINKKKLIGETEIIFKGTKLQKTEGPHIYYINGYYYLFTAEGGSQYGHSVSVARSKYLKGPYEVHPENPILTSWHHPENYLQKTGHASLIQTNTKEWYITYLASRPIKRPNKGIYEERGFCTLGRETAISRITWKDNWPYVEGGKVAQKYIEEPKLQEVKQSKTYPEYDKFDKNELNINFQTLRVPFDGKMGIIISDKNRLRLFGQESLYSVFNQSLVARRWESLDFEAETCVSFKAQSFQEMAGLVCYYNSKNWTSIHITHNEKKGRILNIMNCSGAALSWPLLDKEILLSNIEKVYLRVIVNSLFYRFAYSFNGDDWFFIDTIFDTYKLSDDYIAKPFLGPTGSAFTGAFVGMHCNDLSGNKKKADFFYFKYIEK